MTAGEARALADIVARGVGQANRLFDEMIDALPVAIYTTDAEGRLGYFNAAAAKLSGRVPELGTDQWCVAWKLFLPDGTPLSHEQCPMAIALQGGEVPARTEWIAQRPDGTRFWFAPYTVILRDAEGRVTGGVHLLIDLTDRKSTESKAVEASEQYRAIVETTTECVKIVAPDGTLIFMNSPGLAMIDAPSLETMIGKSVYDGVAPEDRDKFREFNERICAGERGSLEFSIIGLKGVRRRVETHATPLRRVDGSTIHLGLTRDVTERKEAEEALRQSEERFRLAVKATNDAIWDIELATGTVRWNETYAAVYGRPPEASNSWQWWIDRIHAEDRERTSDGLRSTISGDKSIWTCEYRLQRVDGTWAYICDRAYIARDTSGTAWRVIGAMQDQTERKQAETMLRESEERLRNSETRLIDAQRLAKVGSWELDVEDLSLHWSGKTCEIFGVDASPAIFADFLNYVHPKDREKILETHAKVRSSRAPSEVDYRVIRPDGETRFVHSIAQAVRDNQGTLLRITGAIQDRTEQVQSSELLRESEKRLKNAERLAHVGNWQWDIRTNRVSGSEEMYRIFGVSQDVIPTQEGFLQGLIPQDKQRVEDAIRDSVANKTEHTMDYQIVHPDGDLRTIACTWELFVDEDGSPARMFGTCQDITESKRAQEESLARQKLESLGVLASGISHDFNNVLGGILAEAELVETDLAEGSAAREEIQRIKAAAIRGAEIVRQLMIYAGQDEKDLNDTLDLSQLVEEMLVLLKVSISKRAALKTDLLDGLPLVAGSAPQIRQLVMNLVINASEAIGEADGVITVATARVSGRGELDNAPDLPVGDYVQLEVSDSGSGMTEETKAKIFDPFFSTKFAGRGLGLAAVQGIVRAHGGGINLVSAPGQGTKFEVLLPCASNGASGVEGTSRELKQSGVWEGTILVVEDEETLRVAVSKALRKKGHSVMEASDGSLAMNLLRAYKDDIDAVLLDVTLPGISSRDIFEEVLRMRPGTKVIVTSAYGKDAVCASFAGLPVDYFIRKPFQFDDLASLLGDALSATANAGQASQATGGK